jgi:ADP-ribose pyrophosphatase
MNSVKKWSVISRKTVFKKYSRAIEKVIYKMPDGTKTDFYLKRENSVIAVLALTKDKKVVLAKQFRPGPNEILAELPGGGIEKGEDPKQSAARELLEETGYRGKMEFVTRAYDCAYSTQVRYCFVATDCVKIQEPKMEVTEMTEVVSVSLEEFRELLRSGKLTDVEVGYLGLDYLKLL